MAERDITLSVVSHGQNALVNQLFEDVQRVCADRVVLVLTQNVPDPTPFAMDRLTYPVQVIVNERVKGFGANHNAAFARCRTPYFCVANPDIRLGADPFAPLLETLSDEHVGVAGPLVRNPAGNVEDSARRFPTAWILLQKLFAGRREPDYPAGRPLQVDWIGGMFMLFRSEAFTSVGSFDEAYFLYYEDADICRRLGESGRPVFYDPRAEVMHDARRASHRSPRLALHHLASMIRFLRRNLSRE